MKMRIIEDCKEYWGTLSLIENEEALVWFIMADGRIERKEDMSKKNERRNQNEGSLKRSYIYDS